jgi:hypothetical protein
VSDFAISNLPALVTQVAASSTAAHEQILVTSAETSAGAVSITAETKVDLHQTLSFVIDEEGSAKELSDEELSALEQRRLDLIMWLLNLEQRLSPYCADFA